MPDSFEPNAWTFTILGVRRGRQTQLLASPMQPAIVFHTFLFLALVAIPAGLVLVVLLFLVHGRDFRARQLSRMPAILGLWKTFPRAAALLDRRLDPNASWGLSATVTGIGIVLVVWFFLGVLHDNSG